MRAEQFGKIKKFLRMNPVAIVVSDFVDAFIDFNVWLWGKAGEAHAAYQETSRIRGLDASRDMNGNAA